jgi:hypothetical protein
MKDSNTIDRFTEAPSSPTKWRTEQFVATKYEHPAKAKLAFSRTGTADVLRILSRFREAREEYEKAIAIREALVKGNPDVTMYRSHLASSVRRLGLMRLASSDFAGAVADARRAMVLYEGLPTLSGEDWYELACCHATLAAAGRNGSGNSSSNGENEADKAMTLLRKAEAEGFRDTNVMTREPALDPLRNRLNFKLLMLDLVFLVDPFAR